MNPRVEVRRSPAPIEQVTLNLTEVEARAVLDAVGRASQYIRTLIPIYRELQEALR